MDDLYTEAEVTDLLAETRDAAFAKGLERSAARVAALEAALKVAAYGGLPADVVVKALKKSEWDESKHQRAADGKFGSGGGSSEPEQGEPEEEPEEDTPRDEYGAAIDHDEYDGSLPYQGNLSDDDAENATGYEKYGWADAHRDVFADVGKHLDDKDYYAAAVAEHIEDPDDRKAFKAGYAKERAGVESLGHARALAVADVASAHGYISDAQDRLEKAKSGHGELGTLDKMRMKPEFFQGVPDEPRTKAEAPAYKAALKAALDKFKQWYAAENIAPIRAELNEYKQVLAKKLPEMEKASTAYQEGLDGLAEWVRHRGDTQKKALPPDPEPEPADGDAAALLLAAITEAQHALAEGEDPQDVLDALHDLRDDPDALREALGEFAKAGTFNENLHPRSDNGRFVSKKDIHEAQNDPKKAEKLREKVTDPDQRRKLDNALKDTSGEFIPAKEHRKQLNAGRRAEREGKRKANRRTAMELANKIRDAHASGRAVSADDLHDLIPHLGTMTHDELSNVRTQLFRLGASFGGTRRLQDRANRLAEWARGKALEARMAEQGFSAEEQEAAKEAVGLGQPEATPEVASQATEPVASAEPEPQPEPEKPQVGPRPEMEILNERRQVGEEMAHIARFSGARGFVGIAPEDQERYAALRARYDSLGQEHHVAYEKPRFDAKAAADKARNDAHFDKEEKRVRELPAKERKNGWEIVNDGGRYHVRDPHTKESIWSGSQLSRARSVALENTLDAPQPPAAEPQAPAAAPAPQAGVTDGGNEGTRAAALTGTQSGASVEPHVARSKRERPDSVVLETGPDGIRYPHPDDHKVVTALGLPLSASKADLEQHVRALRAKRGRKPGLKVSIIERPTATS